MIKGNHLAFPGKSRCFRSGQKILCCTQTTSFYSDIKHSMLSIYAVETLGTILASLAMLTLICLQLLALCFTEIAKFLLQMTVIGLIPVKVSPFLVTDGSNFHTICIV